MWDGRVVEKLRGLCGRFIFICSFQCVSDNFDWVFVGMCGPNNEYGRKVL
jgi:hypothetical protein